MWYKPTGHNRWNKWQVRDVLGTVIDHEFFPGFAYTNLTEVFEWYKSRFPEQVDCSLFSIQEIPDDVEWNVKGILKYKERNIGLLYEKDPD